MNISREFNQPHGEKIPPVYGVGSCFITKAESVTFPVGLLGVCYEVYNIGGTHQGISVIFENGEFDGFCKDEQGTFLTYLGESDLEYTYSNVIQLCRDFRSEVFSTSHWKARELAGSRP